MPLVDDLDLWRPMLVNLTRELHVSPGLGALCSDYRVSVPAEKIYLLWRAFTG